MDSGMLIVALAVVAAVFLILFGRRIRSHYGRLTPSAEAAARFEHYSENPDFTYYTSGPASHPTAVMGLASGVTLDSTLWKKQTFKEGDFKRLIQSMQQKASDVNLLLHGFVITDREGTGIGEWYSMPGLHIVIKTTAPGRVSITTPPHDMYERREGA